MRPISLFATIALAAVVSLAVPAAAGQVAVAVAANFTEPAKEIAVMFRKTTGHEAVLSFGSSGQFQTQIEQAAPFDVFLSADQARPKALAEKGLGIAPSRFTYATGKLVLWSRTAGVVTGAETLKGGTFSKLAYCTPAAAPYGAAAVEAMTALGLFEQLKPRLVEGANIAQAVQFVETGNAELGFVALSQVIHRTDESRWLVPQDLYNPIRQDAILLTRGVGNEAAEAFLAFLKSPEARSLILAYGYTLE